MRRAASDVAGSGSRTSVGLLSNILDSERNRRKPAKRGLMVLLFCVHNAASFSRPTFYPHLPPAALHDMITSLSLLKTPPVFLVFEKKLRLEIVILKLLLHGNTLLACHYSATETTFFIMSLSGFLLRNNDRFNFPNIRFDLTRSSFLPSLPDVFLLHNTLLQLVKNLVEFCRRKRRGVFAP